MNPFDYLREHWLASVVLGLALLPALLLLLLFVRQRRVSLPLLVVVAALALFGGGGLLLPGSEVAFWSLVGGSGILFVLLLVVVISTWWSPALACAVAGAMLVGAGGLWLKLLGEALVELGASLVSMRVLQPWWLLLLLLLPAIVYFSFRSLAGLGPVRRWIAIGARCLGIALLALALAELQVRRESDNLTVFFLWDRSLSIPQEIEDGGEVGRDLRAERTRKFINDAVGRRLNPNDKAGVIVFGRYPRLELPPSNVPELKFHKIASSIDDSYTDIASAIKLALASFPEGAGKRIILISDGNENLGNVVEQARLCKQNGVQIDIVPVAAARQRQNEVLVERVEAPMQTEKDARLPIRIVMRSWHPQVVVGNLTLLKVSMEAREVEDAEGKKHLAPVFETKPVLTTEVKLKQGLNTFYFQQPGSRKEDSHTYEAKFIPLRVENDRGDFVREGLAGDRWENNRASATVMARGQKAVLLLENDPGEHKLLVDRLQQAKTGLRVVAFQPSKLPTDPAQLALVLSKFDAVILANLPYESLTEQQQAVLRSNTHDQGCGLIMIGGDKSFGAGGWQGSEVEKALPVTCDLKSTKVEAKGGLVMIMHGSEMPEGNFWQKKIAKLAIEKLSSIDMVGMLYYDWQNNGVDRWHIPFSQVGPNKENMLRMVDTMSPGDMPDAAPSLRMARNALSNPIHELGTKHIIFISDGDHWNPPTEILTSIRQARITCTTVCITTHGTAEVNKMKRVADLTLGRSYNVTNPNQLPEIYIKESRVVSKSFLYEKPFTPRLQRAGGPVEGLPKELDKLYGFVRTTRRPGLLVEAPIQTDKLGDQAYPILAYWQYGLGRSVAFTSDARTLAKSETRFWDHDWANSKMHAQFWEQVVEWSLRSVETGKHLQMTTEYRDGKVRITIDARDELGRPITNITREDLEGGITAPSLKPGDPRRPTVRFEQKNAGIYEAEIKADEVGAYFIHVQAKWKDRDGKVQTDSVRGGVTIPYSPEFAEMESNTALLETLRELTGGKTYADSTAALQEAIRAGDIFRPVPLLNQSLAPVWSWLVLLAAICLLCDVAVRRITFEFAPMVVALQAFWARLRGDSVAAPVPEFLGRLQNRKAQVGEELAKSTRRFDGGDAPVEPLPGALDLPAARSGPRPVAAKQALGPEQKQEPADYMSRLGKAKKKVKEDFDRKKGS